MKALFAISLAGVIAGFAPLATAVTEAPSFERYQVILNRLPFGAESVGQSGPGSGAPPGPPPESFTKTIKMCAMTQQHLTGKLQVGLVDTATKKNYFLKVGDEEDGIRLVEVNYEADKALLRKGTEEVWIGMTDGGAIAVASAGPRLGATPAGLPPPMGMAPSTADASTAPGMAPAGTAATSPGQPGLTPSARERLATMRARRAESQVPGLAATPQLGAATVPAAGSGRTTSSVIMPVGTAASVVTTPGNTTLTMTPGATPTMSAQEKEKAEVLEQRRRLIQPSAISATNQTLAQRLQNYQMDLIRAGGAKGPPLPIQLTPEADSQLVEEGVLPPQE
jgi:hypothetical protein